MDKIRIRQNYENYERVQKAFKEFVHALVWESMDIDAGVQEEEINEHIAKYCRTNGDQMIALTNDSVTKFIKSHKQLFTKDLQKIYDDLLFYLWWEKSVRLPKIEKEYTECKKYADIFDKIEISEEDMKKIKNC